MKKLFFFLTVTLAFIACTKTQFSPTTVSTGSANFSQVICVGNSLTQGIMDGGLYYYGQSNSYPSIIAKQAQVPNFLQPMVTGNGSGYMHLAYINNQLIPIQANDSTYGAAIKADPSWANWGPSLQSTQFNNLGIAGIMLKFCVPRNAIEAGINNIVCGYQNIPLIGKPSAVSGSAGTRGCLVRRASSC